MKAPCLSVISFVKKKETMNFVKDIKDNPTNRLLAAKFSAAIYDVDQLKALCSLMGYNCKIYTVDNHRAALCTSADFAVIVYCGTNDNDDLRTDANYIQRKIPGTKAMVHTGVDIAYNALEKIMRADIQRQVSFGKFIIVTGHSLGGGLAARHTFGFNYRWGSCYTFGSLRVGNDDFCKGIMMWTIRVVSGQDWVTMLPFPKMILTGGEYQHYQSHLVAIDYNGDIHLGGRSTWIKAKGWFDAIADDVVDLATFKDLVPNGIEDHLMESGYMPWLVKDYEVNCL